MYLRRVFTVNIGQLVHHSKTSDAAAMLVIFHCTNKSPATLHTSIKVGGV